MTTRNSTWYPSQMSPAELIAVNLANVFLWAALPQNLELRSFAWRNKPILHNKADFVNDGEHHGLAKKGAFTCVEVAFGLSSGP